MDEQGALGQGSFRGYILPYLSLSQNASHVPISTPGLQGNIMYDVVDKIPGVEDISVNTYSVNASCGYPSLPGDHGTEGV